MSFAPVISTIKIARILKQLTINFIFLPLDNVWTRPYLCPNEAQSKSNTRCPDKGVREIRSSRDFCSVAVAVAADGDREDLYTVSAASPRYHGAVHHRRTRLTLIQFRQQLQRRRFACSLDCDHLPCTRHTDPNSAAAAGIRINGEQLSSGCT